MERRNNNVPKRIRGERPRRPQRIQRTRINRQIPRKNRQIRTRRNRFERIQNNRIRGRFGRFNNFRRRIFPRRIIYVGKLPFRINDDMLFRLFRVEGNIISARIVKDFEGKSKGFGFVEFQNPRDAFRSIKKWNNTFLDNRTIIVRYRARPKRFIQNNGRFIPRGPRGRFGQRPGKGFMQQGRNIKRGRRF